MHTARRFSEPLLTRLDRDATLHASLIATNSSFSVESIARAYSDFPFRKVVSLQTMVRKALTVWQKLSRTTRFDRVTTASLASNRHLLTYWGVAV